MEVKGVYKCHCVGTDYGQELLDTLVHLSDLGISQNTHLAKWKRWSGEYASGKNLPLPSRSTTGQPPLTPENAELHKILGGLLVAN